MRKELGDQMEQTQKLLSLCLDALKNDRIKGEESRLVSACADDFTKLFSLRLRHEKKGGTKPSSPESGLPNLEYLTTLVEGGNGKAASVEAKRIRALMKPILESARV